MSPKKTNHLRVAVVTARAQGIGRAVALALAQRGLAIALSDLRAPVETLVEVRQITEAIEYIGDISNENLVVNFGETVKSKWGRVDVLVNNAGISAISPAEKVSASQFRRVLEVNLLAPFMLCRVFGLLMLAQGSGSIINIASIAGLMGISDRVAYNASKNGMIRLT